MTVDSQVPDGHSDPFDVSDSSEVSRSSLKLSKAAKL